MEIYKKLKLLREQHNLTQDELAAKLKLSRSAISNYESGFRTPDINTLYDICNFYNITLDSLFSDEIEYKEIKKYNRSKSVIYAIIISLVVIVMLIILIPNLTKVKYNYGYDIDNDELKVNNCEEISIVKFKNEVNRNTYEIDIINKLKGNDFKYITIHNNKIDINIENYYLVFGNRVKYKTDNNNYLTIDHINIYDNQFIYEINNFDPILQIDDQIGKANALIDYYSYYINNEKKTENLIKDINNFRKDEVIINNKDQYANHYDYLDLNILYSNLNEIDRLGYKFVDIDITMKINIPSKVSPIIYVYNSIENKNIYKITNYKIDSSTLNNNIYDNVTLHFENISLVYLKNHKLIVRYGYDSLINSSWTNSDINIRLCFKK